MAAAQNLFNSTPLTSSSLTNLNAALNAPLHHPHHPHHHPMPLNPLLHSVYSPTARPTPSMGLPFNYAAAAAFNGFQSFPPTSLHFPPAGVAGAGAVAPLSATVPLKSGENRNNHHDAVPQVIFNIIFYKQLRKNKTKKHQLGLLQIFEQILISYFNQTSNHKVSS